MQRLEFRDMNSLVTAVKEHRDWFPVQMDRIQAINDLIYYYERMIETREFEGPMRHIKTVLAKIPIIKKKFACKMAKQVMAIYPQSRCDAYITDTIEEITKYGEKYEQAYNLLDEESRHIYIDLLMLRVTGDFTYMLPHARCSTQYFSSKIEWKDHPNVVDCGAFTGDTFLAFYDMNIIPNHYYLYELNDENYKKMLNNVRGTKSKVYPRRKGVSSEHALLYYEALGDSSHLVSYETDQKVEVVKIDDDVKERIDFIKMDIEGGEADALKGAKRILNEYHPTLAICIYHLKNDFWNIPLLINKICPAYNRYWIEHYSFGYNETVLFAEVDEEL